MPDPASIDVALFPIPNVVAFPGTVLPLHVFEPRYRQLVNDCVKDDRMVAVSHTLKTIHEPRIADSTKTPTLEQALSSNQATYQPRDVFTAGRCKVIETTTDGRIMVEIMMSHRLKLGEDVQSLPYRIVSCDPLEDETSPEPVEDNRELQQSINSKLIAAISTQNPELARQFEDPAWTAIPPDEFSFKIFQFLRFDPDIMQSILEARSANTRLQLIWDLLRQAYSDQN